MDKKKEFKGTKGEWWACCTEEGSKSHYVFSKNSESTICAMRSNDPDDKSDKFEPMEEIVTVSERQANAKLIAASPDLLKACIHALEMCQDKVMPTENDLNIMAGRLKSVIEKSIN